MFSASGLHFVMQIVGSIMILKAERPLALLPKNAWSLLLRNALMSWKLSKKNDSTQLRRAEGYERAEQKSDVVDV